MENNNPAWLLISGRVVAAALCGAGCLWAWGAISDTRCQNTHQTLCTGRNVRTGVCTHLYTVCSIVCAYVIRRYRTKVASISVHLLSLAVGEKGFHTSLWHWIFPSSWLKTGFPCACRCLPVTTDIWSHYSSDALANNHSHRCEDIKLLLLIRLPTVKTKLLQSQAARPDFTLLGDTDCINPWLDWHQR